MLLGGKVVNSDSACKEKASASRTVDCKGPLHARRNDYERHFVHVVTAACKEKASASFIHVST